MQSAAPKFFRSDADFPIFRGLCRARMPAGVWKTGCRRGQKRRRCGAAGGLVRTEGSGPVRRGGLTDGRRGWYVGASFASIRVRGMLCPVLLVARPASVCLQTSPGRAALSGRRRGGFGNLVRTRYLCGRNHSLNHVSQKGTYLLRSEVRHCACLPGPCPLVQRLHLTDKVCRRSVRGCGG